MAQNPDTWCIVGGSVLTPGEVHPDGVVVVHEGEIAAVGPKTAVQIPKGATSVDAHGLLVVPGLVDLHVNGYGGGDALAPDPASIKLMTRALARDGVTSFYATLITAPLEQMTEAAKDLAKATKKKPPARGAELLGIYLEGPFLSPEQRGSHRAEHLRKPGLAALDFLLDAADGRIRMVGIAPELPGALDILPRIRAAGAKAAVGHTAADHHTLRTAAEAGARHFIHLFNAMPRFHHRKPGPAGFALSSPDTTIEIVADGFHVHPSAIALAYRAVGPDRMVLISDAVSPAGLPARDGERYDVGGIGRVIYEDGLLRTPEGKLAGSASSLLHGVRIAVRRAGVPLEHALQMASLTPARLMGIDDRKGSLEKGKDADILVLREDLTVEQVYVRGKLAEKPLEREAA